jgi:hypothetical protein
MPGLNFTHPGISIIGLPICKVTGGVLGKDCMGV